MEPAVVVIAAVIALGAFVLGLIAYSSVKTGKQQTPAAVGSVSIPKRAAAGRGPVCPACGRQRTAVAGPGWLAGWALGALAVAGLRFSVDQPLFGITLLVALAVVWMFSPWPARCYDCGHSWRKGYLP